MATALGWVAAARSCRSGRSSPRPAAPSSPCHPSPSRRSAVTAASSTGSASPSARPPPSGCAGSSPASHPARSSWTWRSAPSGARQSIPTTPAAPRPPGHQRWSGRPSPPAPPCPGVGDGGQQRTASIIAAQLRHADGGALAQRVYIHQLPQTAPRLAGVIEGVFGPEAREGRAVSAGRRLEGTWRGTRPSSPTRSGGPQPRCCWSGAMWQGQDSNLCRQCRRFYRSHRGLPAGPLLSPPGPDHCSDVHKRPAGSFGRHSGSPPVPPCPARPGVGWREVGGKSLGLGPGLGPAPDPSRRRYASRVTSRPARRRPL
jgi:hypothetical protein